MILTPSTFCIACSFFVGSLLSSTAAASPAQDFAQQLRLPALWVVGSQSGATHATIQAAVDQARDGDSIFVQPGWDPHLVFPGLRDRWKVADRFYLG